ncbi:MAG: hypothetical protein NTAFB09_09890 [Nitrosospira sp.]|nr:DUF2971 domain-containing protein [Nitrosospira sp.]OJY07780.1 MAG: hypothetical protein BGO99_00525 [Nitrosospira sp. 56-18]
MFSDEEIYEVFDPLWADVENSTTYPTVRPLLAHYTSIATLERIMANDEIWFSNPLYMNDMEELRFGMNEGASAFHSHPAIKAACNGVNYINYNKLLTTFDSQYHQFDTLHAFDTYVFCTAEHSNKTTDGLLSMWRGYGGNGNGAAIIFDTAKFVVRDTEEAPFILSNVTYASHDQRREWIDKKLVEFAGLLGKLSIPEDKLYLPIHALFERLKIFSLFTKHHGFSEEREWRVVYLRDRDRNHLLHHMLDYAIGRYGLEPKLKFKVKPIPKITEENLSLETLISQIVLGPSVSSPLAVMAVKRMLEKVGKSGLVEKLIASTTPFRAI